MINNKKNINKNGITLIALVVTIIVLLILVGIAVNLATGENGILRNAEYAVFETKMQEVEEAVLLHYTNSKIDVIIDDEKLNIPVSKNVNSTEFQNMKRLGGEVGFFRKWYYDNVPPETVQSIGLIKDSGEFYNKYLDEIYICTDKIEDLYYLDKETLGINDKKDNYFIDIKTGKIYSEKGIIIDGIEVHSLDMAEFLKGKLINENFQNALLYTETESTTNKKLANNTDKDDPNYEDGFQIISSTNTNNIFKLYNNGDLYGKGIKGKQLNTSEDEMEKVNEAVLKKGWTVPSEVGNYKQIIIGSNGVMFIIDENDELWGYGNNGTYNVLGLSSEELEVFTGRTPVKLNIDGKKVKNVFSGVNSTFVITTDNFLYAAGDNSKAQLGIGDKEQHMIFQKVNFDKVDKIERIFCGGNKTIIKVKDDNNEFFFAGTDSFASIGSDTGNVTFTTFTRIWDGNLGQDIDQDVEEVILDSQTILLKTDGTLWAVGYSGYVMDSYLQKVDGSYYRMYSNISNVKKIQSAHWSGGVVLEVDNGGKKEIWGIPGSNECFGTKQYGIKHPIKLELPIDLENDGVKEVYGTDDAVYYLSNTGKLYGSGNYCDLGVNVKSGTTEDIIDLNISNIDTLYEKNDKLKLATNDYCTYALIKDMDGQFSVIGNKAIMFGDDILQKTWTLVAKNVLYFDATGNFYVDKNGNLWANGEDARALGLGIEEKREVKNYVMVDDENIKGKVKSVTSGASGAVTYVLLNDKTLWATGIATYNDGKSSYYPGWNDSENKYSFVKILENVEFFTSGVGAVDIRIAFTSDGNIYGWGRNQCGVNGFPEQNKTTPYLGAKLADTIGDISNIKLLHRGVLWRAYVVTNDGKFYKSGSWWNGAYDGGATATSYFSQYTYNLPADEKIIDAKLHGDNMAIILTEKGNVYGYGIKNMLGIGSSESTYTETRKLPIENVSSICVGNGYFIAVKNDGTVWAAGNNKYGIMGRWRDSTKKVSNNRYKNAVDWVECPELET